MTDFQAAYHDLETRLGAQAEADGDIYLPNPEPQGPVDTVLVCMEPSASWARSPDEARAKISAGFRNFAGPASSLDGPLLLLVCVRRYLSPSYHITDLSKGVLRVKQASIDRTERWNRWYPLLLEELGLVAAPGAKFFAVGGSVASYLERCAFPHPVTKLLHYSRSANGHRARAIRGHEQEFERFRNSVVCRGTASARGAGRGATVPAADARSSARSTAIRIGAATDVRLHARVHRLDRSSGNAAPE